MPVNILMPALSPTMEMGKLAKWLKKEGDAVKSGDILAEIETDKATMEVEAVDEGTLGKILIAEGTDNVLVNTPIAVILGEGEKASDIKAAAPVVTPTATQPAGCAAFAGFTPTRGRAGVGRMALLSQAPASLLRPSPNALPRKKASTSRPLLGSGPHGRIVLKDVENAKPGAAPATKSPTPALAAGMADDMVLKLFEAGSYDLIPHDGMRKTIARRLTESKQTIPHFYVSVDVTLDNLLALRERLNLQAPKDKDGKHAWKVSVNDFIIKAMAMALIKVPDANVSWTDQAMVVHKHADIGVAVSIPGGLITPIIRKAELKGLAQISTEMKDLATRARAKKLKPEEYTGGSASVSNMGMMNVKSFAAIVNPPQSTILAIGTGERRPVVRGQRHRDRAADDHYSVHGSPLRSTARWERSSSARSRCIWKNRG